MKYVLTITLICYAPVFCTAASYQAELVRIIDGDTVFLTWNNQQNTVRIIGIDTPEVNGPYTTRECFGQEASTYARTLIEGSDSLSFEFTNEYDKYDRALGYLTLDDNRDFGRIMIENGYAYAYRAFDHPRKDGYITSEQNARANNRGLHHPDTCKQFTQAHTNTQAYRQKQHEWVMTLIAIIQEYLY
jgi:endonuclease YncB( thermonuclease family)